LHNNFFVSESKLNLANFARNAVGNPGNITNLQLEKNQNHICQFYLWSRRVRFGF